MDEDEDANTSDVIELKKGELLLDISKTTQIYLKGEIKYEHAVENHPLN